MPTHRNDIFSTQAELDQKVHQFIAAGYHQVFSYAFLEPGQFRTNVIDTHPNSFEKIPAQYEIAWCEKS